MLSGETEIHGGKIISLKSRANLSLGLSSDLLTSKFFSPPWHTISQTTEIKIYNSIT